MKRLRIVIPVVVVSFVIALTLLRGGHRTPDKQALLAEKDREVAARAVAGKTLQQELIDRDQSATTPRDQYAETFRETFPFHTQVLALSDPASDGSRTLIISEPPPDLALGDVLTPLAKILRNHTLHRTQVGNDGWIEDVIASVSGSDAEISSALSEESRRIFGTSYKSYVLPLPAQRTTAEYNLDLDVTAAELRQWLTNDGTFVPVEGGAAVTLTDLLQGVSPKVYSSRTPGLVAWWLPKHVAVNECRVQVRQFALDSDLVIGAFGRPTGILIFGRQRSVPVDLLPPLRYETVELLAAVQHGQSGQLAQSYERNHRFAGHMSDGRDWAPILLSPELIDTEYGSLLNITDQLLKGWSNAGKTHYINFKYPTPSGYPFGGQSVDDKLGANQLVYNWNTKGAGYLMSADDGQYFALNRAGALPVTYIPSGMDSSNASAEVMDAEDVAYDYFAHSSDPNLVRVVQYAAMYQIFSAFDVTNRKLPARESSFQSTKLEEMTQELDEELKSASDEKVAEIVQKLAPIFPERFISSEETQTEAVQQHLATYRADDKTADPYVKLLLSLYAGVRELPDAYARAVAAQSSAWIHTPAVVISWNDQQAGGIAIGGHNLDAKITDVALSADVETVKIAADGSLLLNPNLGPEARSLIRTAARFGDEPVAELELRLQQLLEKAPQTPPRLVAEALDLIHAPVTEPPGLTPVAGAAERGSLRLVGWGRPKIAQVSREIARIDANTAGAMVVERRADAIYLRHAAEDTPIAAFTIEDATDAVATLLRRDVARGRELHIELRGFTQEDGAGFARSCQIRVNDERIPAEVSALVREESLGDDALRALREERFDFSKTKITVGTLEELPNELRQSIELEVPSMTSEEAAHTKIELAFDKATPRGVIAQICEAISDAVRTIVADLGEHFDAVVFNLRLNAAMKRISADTGVDIRLIRQQFRHGQRDLYFAELQDQHERIAARVDHPRRRA
ncbi:MAG TPA: hypothetical protein VGR02_06160 [Thermoanaerobaculia bacterium]|jgi:hypothetical protein|nr:hypothetical protein [Thermoanaerobaculia bacterium]